MSLWTYLSYVIRSTVTLSGSTRVALLPQSGGQANLRSWMSVLCCCLRKISKLGPGLKTGESTDYRPGLFRVPRFLTIRQGDLYENVKVLNGSLMVA